MAIRTLFDDLNDPEVGILGKLYVNSYVAGIIYKVEEFFKVGDPISINVEEYNLFGEVEGVMTYELADCFNDRCAPETFKVKDLSEKVEQQP
tara:strand:+ start:946 stop:1221 length:276 start_codon:yes stop_codon:yes gene_type:complete